MRLFICFLISVTSLYAQTVYSVTPYGAGTVYQPVINNGGTVIQNIVVNQPVVVPATVQVTPTYINHSRGNTTVISPSVVYTPPQTVYSQPYYQPYRPTYYQPTYTRPSYSYQPVCRQRNEVRVSMTVQTAPGVFVTISQ